MSEELKYYENELKLMADSVKTCDIIISINKRRK
jgi:hypothetical protein